MRRNHNLGRKSHVRCPSPRRQRRSGRSWTSVAGPRWSDHQEHQDQVLRPVSDRLIAAAAPKPGERVIDVGRGCGATTIDFAARVSPGEVLGLDISEPMLARARRRAPRDLSIRLELADATVYDLAPAAPISWCRGSASCSSPIRRARSPTCARALNPAGGRLRLLARGQAKSLADRAAARSGRARPSPAPDGPRGAGTVRLRQRRARAANSERRRLRRH